MLIEGRLKLDSWEKEGKKFSKLRVVGEHMQMLGAKGQGGGGGAPRAAQPAGARGRPQQQGASHDESEFTPSEGDFSQSESGDDIPF